MSERLRAIVDSLGCGHGVAATYALDLGERRFGIVFAARVGLFHREPERAATLARRWLAPGGAVRAFYDAAGVA